MSGMHELVEKVEEAAGHGHGHGGHGDGKGPGKGVGVTMALLGVMLAFCAAMVGASRTELIRYTVEQSNEYAEFQAESTKFRVMEADFEILHALTPNKAELKKFEEKLAAVHSRSGKGDDEDTAEIKETISVATHELADVLTPDKEDEDRLDRLAKKYKHDMIEAKEDAEAYDLAIDTYHEAAEGYEHAQLCAEVGIVIASVALLMASRPVWYISLVVGLAGAGFIGKTAVTTHEHLGVAEEKIKKAKADTAAIQKDDEEDDDKGKEHGGKPEEHGGKPEEHGKAEEPKKEEHGKAEEPKKEEKAAAAPSGKAEEPKKAPEAPAHH
jgi:hypothetical protein